MYLADAQQAHGLLLLVNHFSTYGVSKEVGWQCIVGWYLLRLAPNRPSVLRSGVATGAVLRADPRISGAILSPPGSTSEEVSRDY